MTGCNGNKNVEITNNDPFTGESLTHLSIIPSPITKGQNSKGLFNLPWFLQMLFHGLTMKRTIGKLGDTYLRGIDLFCWSFCDMPFYSTTTTEILNPRVGVENETLHKPLIIKIDFTIKRTTIIAMLQHLIVFLAIFRFRPNTSQTEKTSLTLFCRKFWLFVFGHNQLVGQPLTVALRERKTLQICPQIV